MIEIGELVRTKTGYIGIVENINDFRPPEAKICVDFNVPDLIFLGETDIVKHSKEPIDLIEEGDYVNGIKVAMIDIDNFDEEGTDKKYLLCGGTAIFNDEIETILTKEQYEANCYKLERE